MTETHQQRAFRRIKEKNGVLPSTHQPDNEISKPQNGKLPKNQYSLKMYDTNGYVRVAVVEARNIDALTQQLKTLCSNQKLLLDTTGKLFNLSNIVLIEKPLLIENNDTK